ncbi:hypothetical protein FRC10_002478 [Ceratobasidium sp. 414]|nr:hypothetical protein FRC10_002478 [Ceratobasidium sp. 414]
MMSRVLTPAGALQPASSIVHLSEVIGAADAIPAFAFARTGPVPSTAGQQAPPALASRSNTSNVLARDVSYPHPASAVTQAQAAPATSPPSKHASYTFTTSLRNAEARYNPFLPSRHDHSRAANPPSAVPGNSVPPARVETPTRVGQPSRVSFATPPGQLVQMHSAIPQAYNPPAVRRTPQPQSGPSSSATMGTSHYSYEAAASTSTPGSTSLVPPASLTSLHRRSPSPLKLHAQPAASPRPPTAASSHRQATFIDSPIDYYSRLDSKVPALPPTSAFENSPQSSAPAGPLISITTPVVTPTHNQSFEAQQRQPYAHPQRYLPSQPLFQPRLQPRPSYDPAIRMCVVCFEPEPVVRFAERSPTADCAHSASVCVSCLEHHILIAIHHCGNMDVRCPHEGCGKKLEYWDIYASVRNWGMLVYYEALLLRREVEGEKDFVWCKNPQCRSGQTHKNGKYNPVVICTTCNAKSCYNHDRPWHEGLTCEQYDKQRRDEEQHKATDRYLEQHTKACPKCSRKVGLHVVELFTG